MMRKMGYKKCLLWILLNDDVEWLKDQHPIPSVATCFLADIFGKEAVQVIEDLKRMDLETTQEDS